MYLGSFESPCIKGGCLSHRVFESNEGVGIVEIDGSIRDVYPNVVVLDLTS